MTRRSMSRWTAPERMTEDKIKSNPNDRPEQAKPGLSDREIQQGEVSAPAESGQRAAPGRRPLFRN